MSLYEIAAGKKKPGKYEKEVLKIVQKAEDAGKKREWDSAWWNYKQAAELAQNNGEMKDSVKYLLLAAEASLSEGNLFNAGWFCRDAANSALTQKDYNNCIEYAKKAASYFSQAGSKYATEWSYNLAARAAEEKKDFYAAIRYLRESYNVVKDKEIEGRINKLKKTIPHPLVEEYSDKDVAEDGDTVKFTVTIENLSAETVKNVKITDKRARPLQEFEWLRPREKSEYIIEKQASIGLLKSGSGSICWENSSGESFCNKISNKDVVVKPKVRVLVGVNPPLRMNKVSDLIVLVKNQSKTAKLNNVKFYVPLPEELTGEAVSKHFFKEILPGAEKGVVLHVTPQTIGRVALTNISVEYTDEYYRKYEEHLEPVYFEELSDEGPLQKLPETKELERKNPVIEFDQNPISEDEFTRLSEAFASEQRGFTLSSITMEKLSEYILQETMSITLVGSHDFSDEKLFLFSGKKYDRSYLLTVALKKDGKTINALFKAYSDRKEGLDKFIDLFANLIQYTAMVFGFAKSVEKIEVNEVINIIDSIVQRSEIGAAEPKTTKTIIKDSVVQRSGV